MFKQNKKNSVYPRKAQFYYIKVGLNGVKIIYACLRVRQSLQGTIYCNVFREVLLFDTVLSVMVYHLFEYTRKKVH